jgi:hypothetical protein
MIDFFGIQVGMSWLGLAAIVIGAVLVGAVGQFVGDTETNLEWLPDGVAAFIGGFAGSELIQSGPAWEGVYLVPAIVVGVLAAVVVDLLVRSTTGGSLTHRAHPI